MAKCIVVIACISWLGFSTGAGGSNIPPDLILLHGRIHTQDSDRRIAEAMALRGNTIMAVGTNAEVRSLIGPRTREIDLGSQTVIPGIIDAHTHPASSAVDLDRCSLDDKSLVRSEVIAAIGKCLKAHPISENSWFEVASVNPVGLTLSIEDLDAIRRGPLVLFGADGHTEWANSAALAAAHIVADSKDPPDGKIERDAGGRPTGTLRDGAAIVERFTPALATLIRELLARAARWSLTP